MANLEQLKQKYAPVLDLFPKFQPYGATLDAVDLDGEKLHIKATVPSTVVANRIWDAIKKADAQYADLHHEIATNGPAEQPYTIKSGDTLTVFAYCSTGMQTSIRRSRKPIRLTRIKFP